MRVLLTGLIAVARKCQRCFVAADCFLELALTLVALPQVVIADRKPGMYALLLLDEFDCVLVVVNCELEVAFALVAEPEVSVAGSQRVLCG